MTSLGETIAALSRKRKGSQDNRLQTIREFGANPGQLEMKLYAPRDRKRSGALVVVLHGCTQTAADYAVPAGWLDLAERFGLVILTPEQLRTNNPNLCFNWYEREDAQRGGGEAASIAQMVTHAVRTYDLDAEQVFVTGLSAGGAMTSVMLATYPEMFAGGAVVAGLPYGIATSLPEAFNAMGMEAVASSRELGRRVRGATDWRGPWPTVTVWHGQSDNIVRPAAGEAVASQWSDVHGVTSSPRKARTPDGRDFLVWLSPEGKPVVELHRLAALGHGAAVKADGANGCGHPSRYTPEMGVSSSFEIALGWGLATRDDERSSTEAAAAKETTDDELASATSTPTNSVTQVINDALRAAGLLR
jgi:poly(hydroxyalkanoate) depolymerase family esterase